MTGARDDMTRVGDEWSVMASARRIKELDDAWRDVVRARDAEIATLTAEVGRLRRFITYAAEMERREAGCCCHLDDDGFADGNCLCCVMQREAAKWAPEPETKEADDDIPY